MFQTYLFDVCCFLKHSSTLSACVYLKQWIIAKYLPSNYFLNSFSQNMFSGLLANGRLLLNKKVLNCVTGFLSASWIGDSFRVAEYLIIHTQKFEVTLSIHKSCSALTFTIVTSGFGSKSHFPFIKICLKFIPALLLWLCWMYEIGQPWLNYFKLPVGTLDTQPV